MSTDSADRNLLFGVLAVQLDFVSRDDLIAATSRWVLNKTQPLSRVFVDQGMLSAEESQLIDGVVEKHLQRNNGNPKQSLQSVEAFESIRATLGDLDDADLRSTVEYATLPMEVEDSQATQAFEANETFDAQQRFKILRLHQKGGLGRVSIALDEELNREIALKEILASHADNLENRTRFIREAEITGALQHPGVVPVYSLGKFADGRPYYAMRFIRGMNLQDALQDYHKLETDAAEKQLRFRQLLGSFVDVCDAIEYAHSRGVIHRDLKPSNVMLGDYGETLVVDWGLAKSLGDGFETEDSMVVPVTTSESASSTQTLVGRVVGTPSFMSPEQAAGRLDALGPCSDIYSLGATLYHLATGKVPFQGTEEVVLANVQTGRFAQPREVNPSVPKALASVILKAMSRQSSERYQSARELAEDIERYLAGERVLAYEEPLAARAWRWIGNHKQLVYSSAAALAVVLTALTVSVVLLSQANSRVRASRDAATASYREADRLRQEAERNFSLARDAVRDYYISVSEQTLLKQPGLQPLRENLLRQALVYYQGFLDKRQDDPSLRQEIAQAHFFTGQITQTVDSPANAIPHFEQAAKLQQELLAALPDATELQTAYGSTLNALGGASVRLGQLDGADDYFQRAIEVRSRQAKDDPNNVEAARTLASSLMNLGFTNYLRSDFGTAIKQMQQAQTIRLAHMSETELVSTKLQRDVGMGYYNLALAHSAASDLEQAENNYVAAIEAFQQLLDLDPGDMNNRRKLAACHRMVGQFHSEVGDSAKAVEYFEQAKQTLTQLRMRNPEVLEFSSDLAGVYQQLGLELELQATVESAVGSLRRAIELREELIAEAGSVPVYRLDLAESLREAGRLLAELDNAEQATMHLKRSQQLLADLVKEDPTNEEYARQLQLTNDELARVSAVKFSGDKDVETEQDR
ncbi:MAG: protein kinase [Planctomycetota bacterium]